MKENHNDLVGEAAAADKSKNYLLAAKKFMAAFRAWPDLWHPNRWIYLKKHTRYLCHYSSPATLEEDIVPLKAIVEDKKEPKLYRIDAALAVAVLLHFKSHTMRLEEAADFLREAIRLAEKVPTKEKKHQVFDFKGSSLCNRPMEELISEAVNECKKLLKERTGNSGFLPSMEQMFLSKGIDNLSALGCNLTVTEYVRLQTVGGEQCDCCGKSRDELGLTLLDVCARCNKAYYCGRECQMKQWKAGHKQYCRKPGEFKAGDNINLIRLQSRPEWNLALAQVIEEDKNNKGRWVVKVHSRLKTISVTTDKMKQLRPLK